MQCNLANGVMNSGWWTLRAKLREADPAREYIRTHRGMGYSLEI